MLLNPGLGAKVDDTSAISSLHDTSRKPLLPSLKLANESDKGYAIPQLPTHLTGLVPSSRKGECCAVLVVCISNYLDCLLHATSSRSTVVDIHSHVKRTR